MRLKLKSSVTLFLLSALLCTGTQKAYGQKNEMKSKITYTADGSKKKQFFTVRTKQPETLVKVQFPDGETAELVSDEDYRMARFTHIMKDAPKPWVVKIETNDVESFASESAGIVGLDVSGCPEITRIVFREQNIENLDLKGMENIQELYFVHCSLLKNLDITGVKALKILNVANATEVKIKGFDDCTELEEIIAFNSSLTNLDVSKLKKLTKLDLTNTKTTDIDLSNNTKLLTLELACNQLTKLDVTKLVNLNVLKIQINQLKEIDLSNNKALTELDISENELSELNLNADELRTLYCYKNNLPLSQLPPKGEMTVYVYAPQNPFPMPKEVVVNTVLDLSAEAKAINDVGKEKETTFSVYAKDGKMLEADTDYKVENGKFTFLKASKEPVRIKVINVAFPKFTGENAMYSDWFTVVEATGIDDVNAETKPAIHASSNAIEVHNLKQNTPVKIYGLDGTCKARATAKNGVATFSLSKGIYVIYADGKATKVTVE